MSGKYAPLENFLRNLPENQREITLGFDQIERILNDTLPASAYGYEAWWANEKEDTMSTSIHAIVHLGYEDSRHK